MNFSFNKRLALSFFLILASLSTSPEVIAMEVEERYKDTLYYEIQKAVNGNETAQDELMKINYLGLWPFKLEELSFLTWGNLSQRCENNYRYAYFLISHEFPVDEDEFSNVFEKIKRGALDGNKYDQFNLAMMYRAGYGVEKNKNEAFRFCKKAAKSGLMNAEYHLALMYLAGYGVTADKVFAAEFTLRAAQRDYNDAQFNMAQMYHFGIGVYQDKKIAAEWYDTAAQRGHHKAKLYSRKLQEEM